MDVFCPSYFYPYRKLKCVFLPHYKAQSSAKSKKAHTSATQATISSAKASLKALEAFQEEGQPEFDKESSYSDNDTEIVDPAHYAQGSLGHAVPDLSSSEDETKAGISN